LGQAPAIQHANPQAAAIAGLTGLPVEDATHWYAFVASLALELAGMAAMMRAEVPMDTEAPTPPPISEPLSDATSNVVAMIRPPKTGSVEEFMLACVCRAKGKSVSWAELYVRYRLGPTVRSAAARGRGSRCRHSCASGCGGASLVGLFSACAASHQAPHVAQTSA
jgi:hypothetical protein